MAPPRRRSCLNCVKAKRRCDLAFPQCQRCASKNLACDHPGLENGAPDSNPTFGQDQINMSFPDQDWLMDSELTLESNPQAPDQPLLESTWLATLTNGPNSSLDIQWPTTATVGNPSNWPNGSTPSTDVDELVSAATSNFGVPSDDHITIGAIYHERTRFASRLFKSYPEMFYKQGKTPFIHRHLYEEHTPPVIQDVLSSCALYCGKTGQNESLVFGDISRKATDLINPQTPFLTPIDLLASTQALLLYQIIRLFDGDIRQRADAEAHEGILESWTQQLQGRTQQLPLLTDASASPTPLDSVAVSHWNDWIFEESCRRTVLTSYMLQGIYSFLKFGWDNVSPKVAMLSFTAQAALWNAPSEFHWRDSSKDKNAFPITICQWDTAMEGVKPTDLESLGIMMMALIKGMDITCEWLGRDSLAPWGLEWGTPQTRDS